MSFIIPDKINPGYLVATTGIYSPLSFGIRKFLDCDYSHNAIYIGNGEIIESDWGGVVINPLSKYLDNKWYRTKIFDTKLSYEQSTKLVNFAKGLLKEEYDYSVVLGYLFSKIWRRSRQMRALWNTTTGWTCSEFAATCYAHAGVEFKLPLAQITPKDLIGHFS
ncbi:MAG: YiiX/YebB-like N1pC/P60 family cysteine hydrolase [Candidatus Pacearchaeota archaeon]